MKRTRAQQPKAEGPPQDPAAATATANPKPQRRAKQPRQPKAATGAAKQTTTAAATKPRAAAVATSVAAAAAANDAPAALSPVPEMAPTVPDVLCVGGCGGGGGGDADADADADAQRGVDWDGDLDGGLSSAAAWWTWGVDEEKLLGWFPFVEEDFRCGAAGRAADPEVAAFDHDIWSIW